MDAEIGHGTLCVLPWNSFKNQTVQMHIKHTVPLRNYHYKLAPSTTMNSWWFS